MNFSGEATKNIGRMERGVRLSGGGLLILLGFSQTGWIGWVSSLVGLTLILTSLIRY